MTRGTVYRSAEWRARISHGVRAANERRRARERVSPTDLTALSRPGAPVRPELRGLVDAAGSELEELVGALGGREADTPQRLLLVHDCARLSVLIGALFVRWAQTQDEETATRLGTLIGARRAQLRELGLERHEKTLDLQSYLAARAREREVAQAPRGDANGEAAVVEVMQRDDRAAAAPLERDAREEEPEEERS